MIQGLLLLIALIQLACGLARAGELPEINFDRIVFMSSWTKSGKLLFSNGEYREPVGPGSATELIVKLNDRRAFGKLDGKEAGAVIVVTDPGGSGSFYDLALLVKKPQGWINQEVVFLGDRIKINSIAVVDDEITVDITWSGRRDVLPHSPRGPTVCFAGESTCQSERRSSWERSSGARRYCVGMAANGL